MKIALSNIMGIRIDEVRSVMRIAEMIELIGVPQKDKESDGAAQGLKTAGKAAGFAIQKGQVVAQFGIMPFDTVGLAIIRHGRMNTWGVEER